MTGFQFVNKVRRDGAIARFHLRERKAHCCFSCFYVWLSFFATVEATELTPYHCRIWQTDAGLPNHTVQAIAQTRDGYLWVGTQYGLARFDGERFTIFRRGSVLAMKNSNIMGLREAQDGSLWIATGSGGILKFKEGDFTHYGKADGLANDYTLGPILETADGAIWVGTLGGLSRLKDGKFTTFDTRMGLSNNAVRDLCLDDAGNLWIATGGGLDYMTPDGAIRPAPFANGFKGADVRSVCRDREGTVWFSAGNELHKLKDGQLSTFQQGTGLPYNIIRRLYADQEGNVWVGTYSGLSRFADGKFMPQPGSDALPFDSVNALFEDRERNIWAGSRDGLTQLRPNRFMTYTAQQGVPNNNVMSVLQDRAGKVWIGTWGGGLSWLENGNFMIYSNQAEVPALALALHEDRSGALWAGTDYGGGLFRISGDSVQHFSRAQGLPDRAIRVVYEDSQTNLWIGSSRGLYVRKGSKFRAFAEKGLENSIIREIHQDRSGNLWVATEDGLWKFRDGKGTKFTSQNGLSESAVISLYEDQSGDLWIGTAGGGLDRLHDGNFVSFSTTNGLFSDTICEILEDNSGCLWMSSPRGVFRVKRADLERFAQGQINRFESVAYGRLDGMASELCNGVAKPGAWKSKDGRLWFATSKGVSVVDPNAPAHEDRSPPLVLVERVLADKLTFPAQEAAAITNAIRIPPGNGNLEFKYAALCLRAPEKNRFKYKLEPVNDDWVDGGSLRSAYYHNLEPGNYRFHVIACNNNGLWNETGASAEVILTPHLWQTRPFQGAVVVAIGFGFFGLHRLRVARLREIDRFRLRLAADLHDDVGSNLSTISLLSRRALKQRGAGDPTSDDLASIHRISRQTANAIREIVWLINPEYDTMQDLVGRMKEAANSILAGVECDFKSPQLDLSHKLTLQFRQNLFLLYKEALTNVARHAQASRVQIDVSQEEDAWRVSVRDNGVGFDPNASYGGNGLKNLRLRAQKLSGILNIESHRGQGTTVSFSAKKL
jgi:ligand-binding sensor domain-containing protein